MKKSYLKVSVLIIALSFMVLPTIQAATEGQSNTSSLQGAMKKKMRDNTASKQGKTKKETITNTTTSQRDGRKVSSSNKATHQIIVSQKSPSKTTPNSLKKEVPSKHHSESRKSVKHRTKGSKGHAR